MTKTPTDTICAARIELIARNPFLSPSSLSSPPAVSAIKATASVSNKLSCSITSALRMPSSKGAGRARPVSAFASEWPNTRPAIK
ncbi:MAG: hypothetical protein JRJ64_03165 [Deltaproteobacteria bacterium]|nr:hypothetical protein [Deltaproteobacteria bacterium]